MTRRETGRIPSGDGSEETIMAIHGRRADEQTSPIWGVAMSAAAGDGIVPRAAKTAGQKERPARSLWSRTRSTGPVASAAPLG